MVLKNIIRTVVQKILGYETYLFVFAVFNVKRREAGWDDAGFMYFVNSLPQEGTILDIGANIGFTTALMARKRKEAAIYAIEPVPDNVKTLKRLLKYYSLSNVKVLETALGDKNGSVDMVIPFVYKAKMQGLSHVVDGLATEDSFKVPIQRLDDMFELETAGKIVAVKIDVENYEYPVLRAGAQLIQQHRPLVYCELMEGDNREHCIALMRDLHYQVRVYEKGELVEFTEHKTINFFFIP